MLQPLRNSALGRVYLANAHLALTAGLVSRADMEAYLKACEKICTADPAKETKKLIEEFPNKDYFFKRLPIPDIFDDLTTVIYIESLDTRTNNFLWLINKDALNTLDGQIPVRGEIDDTTLLEILRNQSFIKPEAKIGQVDKPAWFAPKEDIDGLKINSTKVADDVRDALGLAHVGKDFHMIQITIKQAVFAELYSKGDLKFAAPTFIEARSHGYFRTWTGCIQNWGRTRHLSDANHSGIKEAVSSPVPYHATYNVDYLGKTQKIPDVSDAKLDEHVHTLIWDEIVNDLQVLM